MPSCSRNPKWRHDAGRAPSRPPETGPAIGEAPPVEIGRSVYRLETPDRLVVRDSVLADDGDWQPFAPLHYRRNKG
jgi:hypothetical protein